jgi:hypothetical protein
MIGLSERLTALGAESSSVPVLERRSFNVTVRATVTY